MSSDVWTAEQAERYDAASADMFAPAVLGPTVDLLADLAGEGRILEFAVGTGRVAIPLAERGLEVAGIELSQPMVDRLHAKRPDLPVAVGDMATTVLPGEFALVYLVYNTLGNLRRQDEQVACFANAARHLAPGGRFLVEIGVPSLRRLPPGQAAVPFEVSHDYAGFDTYDLATQDAISHHYSRERDGSYRYAAHHYRFVWPSECDLMARLAGLELESRWADWDRSPFTGDSEKHVSVWRKPD